MQFRSNPKTGESLSALGYGCMRFTKRGGVIDQEKAEREMLLALENGVNYFDTAYIYPGSEACLGKFIQHYQCRDRLYIATKLPQYRVNKIADAEKFFAEELERLQTDHVDYYLMHMLNDASSWQRLCALGIREWIDDKKKSGAIRNIGFSFLHNHLFSASLVRDFHTNIVAWANLVLELHIVHSRKEEQTSLVEHLLIAQRRAPCLRHRFNKNNAWNYRIRREMSLEEKIFFRELSIAHTSVFVCALD